MRLGMFEVHCDDLIRSLAKRAEALCQKLLGKMSEDHKEANKKWEHCSFIAVFKIVDFIFNCDYWYLLSYFSILIHLFV